MSSFDASSIVEPLDYNFEKYGGRKAVIPEPNEEQVITYYKELDELLKSLAGEFVKLPAHPTAQDLVEALAQLTMSDSYSPMQGGMTRIVAKLCSNTPTEDEIRQLPPRMRALFFQWVAREMRPELNAADSKPVLRPIRIAQGG